MLQRWVSARLPVALNPQKSWHEVAEWLAKLAELRWSRADHLHSGLDIHGSAGEAALSVYDEKVSSPIQTGLRRIGEECMLLVQLHSHSHRRNANGEIKAPDKFKLER